MEKFLNNSVPVPREDAEEEAQTILDALLDDPENDFLTVIPQNHERIEGADSSQEALEIAQELILKRLERTFKFEPLLKVEGFEMESIDFRVMHEFLEDVRENNEFLGEGGYATVVTADNDDIAGLPAKICYKITKINKVTPDLNSLKKEALIQGDVFEAAKENPDSMIGVPEPLYVSEIGRTKVLAMEALPALSIKDLKEGDGTVPDWLDIDKFKEELETFVERLHEKGIYHRDLHEGNIMIRQSEEPPEDGKHGYVIDFGFSDHIDEKFDNPYRKEVNGRVFTYLRDRAIIKEVGEILNSLRN